MYHRAEHAANRAILSTQVTKDGLTSAEAAKRLEEYGPNKLPEGTRNPFLVYLRCAY